MIQLRGISKYAALLGATFLLAGGGCPPDTPTPIKPIPIDQFLYDREQVFSEIGESRTYQADVPGARTLKTSIMRDCDDREVYFDPTKPAGSADRMTFTVSFSPALLPNQSTVLELVHDSASGARAHTWLLPVRNTTNREMASITFKFVDKAKEPSRDATEVSYYQLDGQGGDQLVKGNWFLSARPSFMLDAKLTWHVMQAISGKFEKFCD